MKKDSKERLFEMMSKVDKSFKIELNENLYAKYKSNDIYKYAVKSKYVIGFQGREDILYFNTENEALEYVKENPNKREYIGLDYSLI